MKFFTKVAEKTGADASVIPALGCLAACAGTGVAGWIWGTKIWSAMAAGGVDMTGRVLLTVFVAGEFSCLTGLAAGIGVAAIAGMSYCCIKACCTPCQDTATHEQIATAAGAHVIDITLPEAQSLKPR